MNTSIIVKSGNKTWLVTVLIVVVVLLMALGTYSYLSQRKVINLLEVNALQTQRLEEYNRFADQIRQFNNHFAARFGAIRNLENLDVVSQEIQRIKDADNVPDAVDSLVNEFDATVRKIEQLGDRIENLEKDLGAPYNVKTNDTHSQICLDYLTKSAKLSHEDALNTIKHTALIWELEPGNKVFNLYYNGIFLTTVTQGDAKTSPLIVQQRNRNLMSQKLMELQMQIQMQDSLSDSLSNVIVQEFGSEHY